MIYDLAGIMETWGDEGIADPFENIYEVHIVQFIL